MSLSDTIENTVAQWLFSANSVTRPTTWYVALGSAASDSSFTEISGSGYARVQVSAWTISSNTVSNTSDVIFPIATGSWNSGSSFGYFGIYTASSGGTFIGSAALDTARTVVTDSQPSFASGVLTITFD